MDSNAFVEAARSINTYEGTREGSHSPVHWVIGIQTLALALELAMAH